MGIRVEIGAVRVEGPRRPELDARVLEARIHQALVEAGRDSRAPMAPEAVTALVTEAVRAAVVERREP